MAPTRKYVCVPGTQCLPLREHQVRPLYSAVPLASLGCDKPWIFPVSFATPFFPSASSSPFPWRGCHLLLPHPVLSVFLVSPFSFALAQNPSWTWVESRRRDSLPTLSKLSDRTWDRQCRSKSSTRWTAKPLRQFSLGSQDGFCTSAKENKVGRKLTVPVSDAQGGPRLARWTISKKATRRLTSRFRPPL